MPNVKVADLLATLPERPRRSLNTVILRDLVKSIAEIGLQHPVSIYYEDSKPHVIAGMHRLLAYKELKREEIPCTVLADLDPITRELWELDENLARAEMQTVEWGKAVKRKIELMKEALRKSINGHINDRDDIPPPLTKAEVKRRHKARARGEIVPPTPRQAAGVPGGKPPTTKVVAEQFGLSRRALHHRMQVSDPEKRDTAKATNRTTATVSCIYQALTTHTADWPEVKRRVEDKLGKPIIARIEELERGPADVVDLDLARKA